MRIGNATVGGYGAIPFFGRNPAPDGVERGESGGRGMARQGGSDALDFLVGLVGGISGDEFVLFELDDDVGASLERGDVQAARLDELDVDLTLGWTGCLVFRRWERWWRF